MNVRYLWSLAAALALAAPAHAQPAPAPVQATVQQAKATAPLLGRLFMSPERRQLLDRQRLLDIRDAAGPETDKVELNGVVQRSSGRNSVWINQRMQDPDAGGVRLQPGQPGSARIEMEQTPAVQLRVGESLNRSTQERKPLVPPHAIQPGKKP